MQSVDTIETDEQVLEDLTILAKASKYPQPKRDDIIHQMILAQLVKQH